MNRKSLLAMLIACMTIVGCKKDVSYDTLYILKSWNQATSGGELSPLKDVLLFGYSADTTEWYINSYDDALNGIFTSKVNPDEKLQPKIVGEPMELEGFGIAQSMRSKMNNMMVLAVDTENRLYGYTQHEMAENMPQMYVSIVFHPWKQMSEYKNGTWWMFNDFYMPDIKATIRPTFTPEEGAESQTLMSLRVYAYSGKSKAEGWMPASFDQAGAGKLTDSSLQEVIEPDYTFSADYGGVVTMKFKEGDYLLMAYDALNGGAFALRDFSPEEADSDIGVEFAPWRVDSPFENNGWTIYNQPTDDEGTTDDQEEQSGDSTDNITE